MKWTDNKDLKEFVEANIPDVLKGMNVDWILYIPPGGLAWQKMYATCYRKEMSDRAEALKREIAISGMAEQDIAACHRDISKIRELVAEVRNLLDFHSVGCPEVFEMLGKKVDYVENNALPFVTYNKRDVKKTESAIAVLSCLRDLFDKDARFDMLMWSLNLVDRKYRTKIFREAYRLYNDIVSVINTISGCEEKVDDPIANKHVVPYNELHTAYDAMAKVMKFTKKGIATKGNDFWKDDKILDDDLRRRANSGAGTWDVV